MANLFEQALDSGEPKRLLIFGAIAEAGSIGAAARNLGWSQPALSQHMTALEKDLGVTLFDRTPRGIRLTTAGQLASIRAAEVAASVTGLRGDLAKAFGLGGRNVRLAGFPSFVIGPLAAALGRLEADAGSDTPQHHSYEVAEAEPPEAMALLEDGAIDIAFLFHHEDETPPELPGHVTVDLGTDHLDLLVPERWNRAGQVRHLTDVVDLPWIMGCVRCRSTAERLCRRAGFEPRTRHITDNPGAIQSLVSNGLGVALLPRSARRYSQVAGIDSIVVAEAGARRVTAMIPDGLRTASEVEDLLNALRLGEGMTETSAAGGATSGPDADAVDPHQNAGDTAC
ncbi:DNA-binding transcriptional regulator, LysR family [Brevibacterium iodinum ATCC 49514]|uniref:DNA-binding transcriptional regulator, LysR family n=1 Tax=Brevibacterium iodinum ATCC 49514 TaxID=1255616 RepID=A0A2H1KMQ2_9MICO|nr:LysR family transcriptional regulator [Brevibacterium iodinum]SMY00981.1 DNA-binding transcriptional regulator, LysR family [Brevibacterium iodinum ATCC 49514]SUW12925.1 HTH-type transcriptional regulator gltC [Brevibacterium iodinum]